MDIRVITPDDISRLGDIDIKEHCHIVDSYACLGREPEAIAIRQGIDLKDIIDMLTLYGFGLGTRWGHVYEDRGKFKKMSRSLIDEFVSRAYPDGKIRFRDFLMDKDMREELEKGRGEMMFR